MKVVVADGRYELDVEYGNDESGLLKVDVWGATEVSESGELRTLPLEVAVCLAAEFGEHCYEVVADMLSEQELAHRLYLSQPDGMH